MYATKLINLFTDFEEGIAEGARLLQLGDVVAFPTETVYGLGGDALRPEAVRMIFAAKGRPQDNPLIAHVHSIEQAQEIAYVTPEAAELMEEFWPAPLTLVLKKKPCVPFSTTAGLQTVALRMPDNEAALELIRRAGTPVAAPSANLSGRPSPTTAQHVLDDLDGRIPLVLDGGPCEVGIESTVVALEDGVPVVLRPGIITPDMIADVLGDVRIASGVLAPFEGEGAAASPGMKYRHYAPQAKVVLVAGEGEKQAARIGQMYDEQSLIGKKCVIFSTNPAETFYKGKNCVIMGDRSDLLTVCNAIFGLLRQADADGYDVIFIEAMREEGLGLACMNRLLRAADFEVIR